ncbi:MAG: AMP-binding protein [Planctomycetaceae bacterium]|nr:AMP-binding protein [Planctomycetaceae bacterium]
MNFPEQLDNAALRSRQLQRLQALVAAVEESNPFWSRKLAAAGVDSQSLNSLEDFRSWPVCTKQELVDDQNQHPSYGSNLTYGLSHYCRLHQTSGTTGKPMKWLDTRPSWDWFMDCWAQIYRIVGITASDVFAFPFSFGPFIGFWAAFEGAQRLGNLCLTMGGMTSEARLRMIAEMQATVICCTPTYALRLTEVAEKLGLDLQATGVRKIIVAGEPGGAIPAIRTRIEQAWGARVFDHWGMTDIGSLGIEPEAAPGGLLILETEAIAEVVDPESLAPMPPGEVGELLITNLGRWGQPVIRYRTGDLVRVATDPCPSGLELMRLEGGILGRADDMVTIRGNNVFPSSLDAILREFASVIEYRTTVETRRAMPHLRIELEPTPDLDVSAVKQLVDLVQHTIKDRLNFVAEVVAVPVDSLPRFELKGRRFHRQT